LVLQQRGEQLAVPGARARRDLDDGGVRAYVEEAERLRRMAVLVAGAVGVGAPAAGQDSVERLLQRCRAVSA
jgi:hypothetical protein